tara:strand:- start:547 stop:1869 length:1323 start_codon:yes stop_codon:yes gene_type:complete
MIKRLKRLLYLLFVALIATIPVSYLIVDWKGLYVSTLGYQSLYTISLHKQSLNGDVDAMYLMAENYDNGWNGLEIDYKKARYWFQKASDNGHEEATNSLALMYRNGEGVEQDYGRAVSLFNKAISLGSLYAYSNLGAMYRNGEGVDQDYKKAFALFKTCTDKSTINTSCFGNLGWMYNDGLGTEQNFDKAFYSWLTAAKQGDASAQFQIGYFYDVGKGHIEKDRVKALEWYKKSASQDYAEAQRFIGYIYLDGIDGISEDYLKAGEYFYLSAKNGSSESRKIIEFYVKKCSNNVEHFIIQYDFKSCSLAAFSGNPNASHAVGGFYLSGKYQGGVDAKQAVEWYRKSALQGYSIAQFHLAYLYDKGQGAKRSVVKAYVWVDLAIRSNDLPPSFQKSATKLKSSLVSEMTDTDKQDAEILINKTILLLDLKQNLNSVEKYNE